MRRARCLLLGVMLTLGLGVFSLEEGAGQEVPLLTFSEPINLSQTTGLSEDPAIAVDRMGTLNVAWVDDTLGKNPEIFFRRCSFEGDPPEVLLTCEPRLPDGPEPQPPAALDVSQARVREQRAQQPAVATNSTGVFVAWQESEKVIFLRWGELIDPLKVAFSDAFMASAPEPKFLEGGRTLVRSPVLVTTDDPGQVFVLWEFEDTWGRGPEIRFRSFIPFAPIITVSERPGAFIAARAPTATLNRFGKLFVAFEGRENGFKAPEIFLTHSNNPGTPFELPRFTLPMNISGPNTPGDSLQPAVATDEEGVLFAVWSDNTRTLTQGDFDILLRREGAFEIFNLSELRGGGSPLASKNPVIAVDRDTIYVAWQEELSQGQVEIFLLVGQPDPRTRQLSFSKPQQVSNAQVRGAKAKQPALAVDRGIVYLAWQEGDGQQSEIFLAIGR